MTQLISANDPQVEGLIQDVATNAVRQLDERFPGWDNGGISSNFQGHLEEVLKHMLMGRAPAIGTQQPSLPTLIVDAAFWGCPLIRGEAFLVQRESDKKLLCAYSLVFRDSGSVEDAWTTFEGAAEAAFSYCLKEGYSLEDAKGAGLRVVPVVPSANRNGYVVQ